tara:strand:+ start:2117 stop:2491 length:375 start_codon:yes stop_codon:yes gene_type:complete
MNARLHKFKVKDCTRDTCEHCGLEYWQEVECFKGSVLRCKVHCNSCITAERDLDKICEVMNKTEDKKRLLSRGENNKRDEFDELLKKQSAKMGVVLNIIKNFVKEQRHSEQKPQGSESRLPYKE